MHAEGGTAAPAGGNGAIAQPQRWPAALLFALLIAWTWSALPALLQSVPHADNVEQLNWAHALQWGYIKHPPMPTWLLHAAISLFGPSAFLTYALGMGCAALALLLVWRCAILLMDERCAFLALLLTSADYYLMGRGSFLNHNTVMLPFVAASAWAVLRIAQGAGWRSWFLLGLVQALGMLTKYQMAIIILANALALLAIAPWRRPRFWAHATLCALATAVPLLPHLFWLQDHDYSTFAYAGHNLLAGLPLGERLTHTLGFVLQQLGKLAPAIIAAGLAVALARYGAARGVDSQTPAATPGSSPMNGAGASAPAQRRALAILALAPLAAVLAISLVGGVAPQNHWGASTTLLLPLFALARIDALRMPSLREMLTAVIAVQAAAVAWSAVVAARSGEFHYSFAARPLAAMALAHWQQHSAGTIEVVIGPDWEAGAIALELPSHPAVLAGGGRAQAPWISDEQIARCGALLLWRPGQSAADQVGTEFAQRLQSPVLLQTTVPRGDKSAIAAGILAPSGAGCVNEEPFPP